jgi:hypothetical protein
LFEVLEIATFTDVLFKYEGALAWEDSEMGCLAIKPPMEIHVVPHAPAQQQNLRLPTTMRDAATQIVKDGRRKAARYESRVWGEAERKYDAIKL